jgi:hypothetical protein
VPVAATVKDAGCPTVTVTLAGCTVMTGAAAAVAGLLEVLPHAESKPQSAKKIETGKTGKSAFLLRLEFDQQLCFQTFTQISNNRLLLLDCVRSWVRIES